VTVVGETMEVDMNRIIDGLALSACATALVAASLPALAAEDVPAATAISKIKRISVSANGTPADAACVTPSFSPDGTKVVFVSSAKSLMAGGGGFAQVYVKTLATGALKRVSTTSAGVAGNADSDSFPVFSPDGTKVLFSSSADNLVPGDTNKVGDVFEKDLTTGAIRRVSTTATGAQADSRSWDARYSPDGKKIAFASTASNLVAGDTNGLADVFVKQLASGSIQRVSVTWDKRQANGASSSPQFSSDGKKVVYVSWATNIVTGDGNAAPDVFVRELGTTVVKRANVSKSGAESNGWDDLPPLFKPGSGEVVFASGATNLIAHDSNGHVDIFAKNLATGGVRRLATSSTGKMLTMAALTPAFDAAGSIMAFANTMGVADALPAGAAPPLGGSAHSDIYVKTFANGLLQRVSTTVTGVRGDGDSYDPAVSADGKLVVFASDAGNLVSNDTNGVTDIFVVTLK